MEMVALIRHLEKEQGKFWERGLEHHVKAYLREKGVDELSDVIEKSEVIMKWVELGGRLYSIIQFCFHPFDFLLQSKID